VIVATTLEQAITAQVTAALVERMRDREASGGPRLDAMDPRILAAKLIADALETHAATCIGTGNPMPTAAEEDELTRAVLNRLFAAAGLRPMLDNPSVMEVNAQGCDDVWVRYRDGQVDRGPVLASSDAEFVELIRTLARDGLTERRFDAGCPRLSLQLPNGTACSPPWRSAHARCSASAATDGGGRQGIRGTPR
jgi:pilus assembly protein CpaF